MDIENEKETELYSDEDEASDVTDAENVENKTEPDEDGEFEEGAESEEGTESEEGAESEEGEDGEDGEDPARDQGDDEKTNDFAAENEQLKKKLERIERNGLAALKKLGVKNAEDLIDGIETLAAEAEGKTLDEYRKDLKEIQEGEDAKAYMRRAAYENMKKADLSELHRIYPETSVIDDIEKIDNFKKFGEFRDKGLTVEEAYAAANPSAMRKKAAEAGRKSALAGTKSHMNSVVPKGVKGDSVSISPSEMSRWQEMFPGKTKKEILDLYKRANA